MSEPEQYVPTTSEHRIVYLTSSRNKSSGALVADDDDRSQIRAYPKVSLLSVFAVLFSMAD